MIWCWPLAMASVTLYALVFFEARLYAEVGLQVLYFGLAAYGWWAWRYGGDDRSALSVSRIAGPFGVALAMAAALGGFALGLALQRFTDASLPLLDSMLASFSVAAQWMQTRKLLEAWLVWIVVDVFYVGMFFVKDLQLTASLYVVFLALATMGFVGWRASLVAGEPLS